jgi:hypothetical protein
MAGGTPIPTSLVFLSVRSGKGLMEGIKYSTEMVLALAVCSVRPPGVREGTSHLRFGIHCT